MMKEKVLTIIAIQDEFLSFVTKQMAGIAGDMVRIRPISIKDLARETIVKEETILLSTDNILPLVQPFLPQGVKVIVANRGLNFVNMKELLLVPKGKHILVVNDTRRNARETIQALRDCVFEHHYYLYEPGTPIPDNIDYVITPGEMKLVPEVGMKVFDIGYRVIALETVFEMFESLGLSNLQSLLVNRYMKSLVALSAENSSFNVDTSFSRWLENTEGKAAKYYFEDMISHSKSMSQVVYVAKKLAKTIEPVHIFGETGTGKSILAQAMHHDSPYRLGPFVKINCAARPLEVLERELFGCEAEDQVFPGLFELASKGTLCIDEIGELPVSLQGRLLQVLEEGQMIRVGGHSPVPIQVRIMTTSNADLSLLVEEGRFRKDLFYHLAALTYRVPSLTERQEDFESLIEVYLHSNLNKRDMVIPTDVISILKQYSWPGNVRELYNVLSYIACLEEEVICPASLPFYIKGRIQKTPLNPLSSIEMDEIELGELIQRIEEHGFLQESLVILQVFDQGKKQHESYGRNMVKKLIQERGISLSDQQLRLRLEVLNNLELLNVRQGRSGTTISRRGEQFLQRIYEKKQ